MKFYTLILIILSLYLLNLTHFFKKTTTQNTNTTNTILRTQKVFNSKYQLLKMKNIFSQSVPPQAISIEPDSIIITHIPHKEMAFLIKESLPSFTLPLSEILFTPNKVTLSFHKSLK